MSSGIAPLFRAESVITDLEALRRRAASLVSGAPSLDGMLTIVDSALHLAREHRRRMIRQDDSCVSPRGPGIQSGHG